MAREPGYCLHKASGQAFVRLGGRITYLGKHGSPESQELYNRLKSEWLLNRHSVKSKCSLDGPTMAEVCLAFLDHAKDYYPTGNEYNNFTQAVKPISELYSMLPAKKFGPVEFRTTRAWWLNRETSRKVGKCSRKTINEQMNRVKRLIKWAVAEGMVEVSVYETLRCVESLKKGRCTAPESKPVKPVDKATVDATLPHLTTVVADMVRVQLLLGCRPGELCKLTPSMFNTTEGIWEIFLEEHKTAHRGKERIIYVGPQAQEILKKYLNRDPDAALFSPAESEQERRDKVHQKRRTKMSCGNRPGSNKSLAPKRAPRTSFDAHSYTRSIANGCKKGKIPIWTANQLRHTRATEIRKRFGLEAAASVLGHSEIGVTQVYAEADMQRAIEVVRLTG